MKVAIISTFAHWYSDYAHHEQCYREGEEQYAILLAGLKRRKESSSRERKKEKQYFLCLNSSGKLHLLVEERSEELDASGDVIEGYHGRYVVASQGSNDFLEKVASIFSAPQLEEALQRKDEVYKAYLQRLKAEAEKAEAEKQAAMEAAKKLVEKEVSI